MLSTITRTALFAGLSLSLVACEPGTGPGAETRVLLSQGDAASRSLSAALVADLNAAAAPAAQISLSDVASIEVALTEVRALPTSSDTTETAAESWRKLTLAAPLQLNLVSLPTTAEAGVLLARGDLPAGSYRGVVVRFSSASVTFKNPVTLGGTTYAAGEKVALTIPSNRIFFRSLSFTVPEDAAAEVRLVFDGSASVRTLHATGKGRLMMNPVVGGRVIAAD